MADNDITVITADFMYLVVIGEESKIKSVVDLLNKSSDKFRYIHTEIDTPCADIEDILIHQLYRKYPFNYDSKDSDVKLSKKEKEEQINNHINKLKEKYIVFGEGVESAQTLTYAEGYNKTFHILLEVEENDRDISVGFPKLCLEDEAEPEKLIGEWIKSNSLANIMDKLVIRPVNIVGSDNEILVFAARIQSND
jgi:hypothetical protein